MSQFRGRLFLPVGRVRAGLERFLAERLDLPRRARLESLKWRGEGLFYTVFGFGLSGAGPLNGVYVIRISNPVGPDAEAKDRMVRSSRLLGLLDPALGLAPTCLAVDESGEYVGHPFTIETFVTGMPLGEARKDPHSHLPIAAQELARVHRVSVTKEMRQLFPAQGSFAEAELERAERESKALPAIPEILSRALDTAAHLRPNDPEPCLLHGDPLLQNLVFTLDFEKGAHSYRWIDWEFARLGDPIYDLSIFTRGQLGNLHGLKGGRDVYRKAYERQSGAVVEERRLLFYELLLVIRIAGNLLREGREGLAGEEGARLRRLLERAQAVS